MVPVGFDVVMVHFFVEGSRTRYYCSDVVVVDPLVVVVVVVPEVASTGAVKATSSAAPIAYFVMDVLLLIDAEATSGWSAPAKTQPERRAFVASLPCENVTPAWRVVKGHEWRLNGSIRPRSSTGESISLRS